MKVTSSPNSVFSFLNTAAAGSHGPAYLGDTSTTDYYQYLCDTLIVCIAYTNKSGPVAVIFIFSRAFDYRVMIVMMSSRSVRKSRNFGRICFDRHSSVSEYEDMVQTDSNESKWLASATDRFVTRLYQVQ